MITKKANIVDLELPKKSEFAIETTDDYPKLHSLMVINGKRGGGKTLALCNFLKEAKKKHYLVLVITPTYNSNKEIWNICDIDKDDVYDPVPGAIKKIMARCEAEMDEWELFLAKKKLYKQYLKEMGPSGKPIHKIDEDTLIQYYEFNFFQEAPEWKYPVEQPPRVAVVLDDCLNSPVMTRPSEGLCNLAIRHRHIMSGAGISIFMLVQSYCCLGGVPRCIRENATHLLLFKINQEQQIKKIKEEADLPITDEEFNEMLNIAHSEPYQFLMLDFSAKSPTKMFRKGWNQYLIPPSLANKK